MIRRRERLLLALSQSSIIDDGDASAAAEAICAAAAEGLAVDRASLWELDADARSMRCVHLYDAREGGHRRTPALRLAASDFPRYFEALQRERTITADDAPRHPDASEFAHGYLDVLGIGAMLDAPVRQHGRLVGILCAEHR
ncbi:MAG: GAF domain-containing protein, partial [Lysobacteraceae bacterium]